MSKKIVAQFSNSPTVLSTLTLTLPGAVNNPINEHPAGFSFAVGDCKHCHNYGGECGYCGHGINYEEGSLDSQFNELRELDFFQGYTPQWGDCEDPGRR